VIAFLIAVAHFFDEVALGGFEPTWSLGSENNKKPNTAMAAAASTSSHQPANAVDFGL
jgi:hypothetical protein